MSGWEVSSTNTRNSSAGSESLPAHPWKFRHYNVKGPRLALTTVSGLLRGIFRRRKSGLGKQPKWPLGFPLCLFPPISWLAVVLHAKLMSISIWKCFNVERHKLGGVLFPPFHEFLRIPWSTEICSLLFYWTVLEEPAQAILSPTIRPSSTSVDYFINYVMVAFAQQMLDKISHCKYCLLWINNCLTTSDL